MPFDLTSARVKFLPLIVVGGLAFAILAALTAAWGHSSGGRQHEPYAETWKCDGPSRHGRLHKRGHYGPDRLVMKLNTMETAIGIRANQLDAWRDFTDALLAVMERPRRAETESTEEKPEPFAHTQRLANDAIARAESAENLKKAIEALRGILTAEQLNKVTELEAKFRFHHKGRFGSRRSRAPEPSEDRPDEATPE
jgi:LTXXQ motif family protein